MRQVSVLLRTSEVEIRDVPPPVLPENGSLVSVAKSALSSKTESASVELAYRLVAAVGTRGHGLDQQLPKELVELHKAGVSAVLLNFRAWERWKDGRRTAGGGRTVDKGLRAGIDTFKRACLCNWPEPVSFPDDPVSFPDDDAATVTSFAALRSVGLGRSVELPKVQIDG